MVCRHVWCVRLGDLNKSPLLKQCACFKANVICLQGCQNNEGVSPLAGVLRLLKIHGKGAKNLREVALIVPLRRDGKVWTDKVARHQRCPSGWTSYRRLPSLHVTPRSVDSTTIENWRPRSRRFTISVSASIVLVVVRR